MERRLGCYILLLVNLSGKFIVLILSSLSQGPKSDLPPSLLVRWSLSDVPLNASVYSKGCFYEQIAHVLLVAGMTQLQNKNSPPLLAPGEAN